jgi:hypothetical protein
VVFSAFGDVVCISISGLISGVVGLISNIVSISLSGVD